MNATIKGKKKERTVSRTKKKRLNAQAGEQYRKKEGRKQSSRTQTFKLQKLPSGNDNKFTEFYGIQLSHIVQSIQFTFCLYVFNINI